MSYFVCWLHCPDGCPFVLLNYFSWPKNYISAMNFSRTPYLWTTWKRWRVLVATSGQTGAIPTALQTSSSWLQGEYRFSFSISPYGIISFYFILFAVQQVSEATTAGMLWRTRDSCLSDIRKWARRFENSWKSGPEQILGFVYGNSFPWSSKRRH